MESPIEFPTAQAPMPAAEDEVTLPRPLAFYEAQAELVSSGQAPLEGALGEALHEVILTPRRYAELMQILDTWVAHDHCVVVDEWFFGLTRTKGDGVQ